MIFCVSLLGYCAVFAVLALALDLQYLLLIFIMGLCSMIQAIYTYTTRGLGYNAVFAVSGIVGSLVNSLTNVALILGFSMTVKSLYLARSPVCGADSDAGKKGSFAQSHPS